jgi:ribosomal protein L6P/L9E
LEDINKDLLNEEILFLSQELKKIIGEKINIIPEVVNEIELSPSGKFKWIISGISKEIICK